VLELLLLLLIIKNIEFSNIIEWFRRECDWSRCRRVQHMSSCQGWHSQLH